MSDVDRQSEQPGDRLARELFDGQTVYRRCSLYALIYGVAFPALYGLLLERASVMADEIELLFEALGDEPHSQYGPFVMRVASDRPDLLRICTERCEDDPRGISFLFSPFSLKALAASLRLRLDVQCEDGTEWQMKLFDTRVLPVLKMALTPEQYRSYLGVVDAWWYVDRDRELKKLAGEYSGRDDYTGPLTLSEAQTTVFIDAGLVDAILYSLSQTDDDLLAKFDVRERYQVVANAIAGATEQERDSALLLADRARCALLLALEEKDKA
jgi:hypothetical protein